MRRLACRSRPASSTSTAARSATCTAHRTARSSWSRATGSRRSTSSWTPRSPTRDGSSPRCRRGGSPSSTSPNHLLERGPPTSRPAWAGRATRCAALEMLPVEAVARGYLTGSGLLDYRATGAVCGIALPAGLVDGDRLPEPIFTPATKAALGEHDENVSYDAVVATRRRRHRGAAARPDAGDLPPRASRSPASAGSSSPTRSSSSGGVRAARTRARRRGADPGLVPVLAGRRRGGPGRAQPSFDKQYVRNWLLSRRRRAGTAPAAGRRRRCPTTSSRRRGSATSRRTSG